MNGGNTISFAYDQDDLLTSAGSETLTNDPNNGLLTGTSLGVVTDSYAYNGFAEMADYEAQVSGTPVFGTVFERDKLGRITKKTETVNGVTHVYDYTYDTAGRLHEVFKDSVLQNTYTYDANGNRLNNGAVYDDQDRLVSTSTATYTYTDNGELASKTEGGQTTTYNYDVVGNLISVTLPDSTLIEYVIDGANRRVGKRVDGVLVKGWLYKDSLNPIAELDGAGNVVARFIYSSKGNVPDYVIQGGVTYRIVSDHLGSPRQVINTSDGTVIQQLDYDEWGNVTVDTNPGFTPFGFAGGIYDQDTKLVRFGFRDYDAEVGRWTSKDPADFSGAMNLFGYARQDPINFVDATGKTDKPQKRPKNFLAKLRNFRGLNIISSTLDFCIDLYLRSLGDTKEETPNVESDVFRQGEDFELTIQGSEVPISFLAEVSITGDILHLKNIAVYGEGTQPLTGQTKYILQGKTQLTNLAKEEGFSKLRLTGVRVPASTSANPGKPIDIILDLD
ncbi:RHS repeat-associated protein [Nitrospina gracilis]|uniref:RHS repeat domain-containing protein n=1 Tax=Nitrospina sp. Nb-3 TaxID=2940485 RepID=UPI001F20DFED|nr:RHS repeat-associated core domain-containing protein [Nitrospina gracilis]MCF8723755.1 RHS repeat-associated protein [Nitrospina sp. Nb-3]